MDRRKALAFAAAVTGVLASMTVAVAAVSGVSLLGFGGKHASRLDALASYQSSADPGAGVITRTRNEYDKVVVGDASLAASTRSAGVVSKPAAVSQAPGGETSPSGAAPRPAPKHARRAASAPSATVPAGKAHGGSWATTTTEPRSTTTEPRLTTTGPPSTTTTTATTLPPVTTTTRPPGVPRDWPPGKPIPPMPPNCRHPQLEDNGVWNCGSD